MTTVTTDQTRKAALEELLRQAPVTPILQGHTYEDEIDIVWEVNGRGVQLEVNPGRMNGQWLSWRQENPLEPLTGYQSIDLADRATWQPLFEALGC